MPTTRKAKSFATLNHGGSAEDNPILEGISLRIKLNKHNSSETLRKCWIEVGSVVFYDLTSLCTSTDNEITVDVLSGTHLYADSPPTKNTIHFTTSEHRHSLLDIWVATRPSVMITLDGYNAEDPTRPLIYPFYRET